jgi:hypothetical protein
MDGAIVAIGSRRKIRARNPEPEPAATKRLCVTPLALTDDNQAAGHNETRQRYDVLQSRNLPELAQQPDEKVRLHEQKHGAGHGRIRDLSGSGLRECLEQDRDADRAEEQRYLQSNSVASACEIDNRQEE